MLIKKIIFLLLILCFITSCMEKLETIDLYIKGTRFVVECARTQEERAKGLMYRKKLTPRTGMIFIFQDNYQGSFWMKNTYIPLSIAFISRNGEILDMKDMEPLSLKQVKSRYPYKYALEVNQGEFEETGIRSGNYVVFPRGFE